jgi:hypothetical protein
MATSSIFNSIQIKDEVSCRSLVNAIESSMKAKKLEIVMPEGVKELKGDDLNDFFKEQRQ